MEKMKKIKSVINQQFLTFFVLFLFFLSQNFYALYIQFDAQPDKVVFGKTNVSGIKFFLWDRFNG